MARYRTFVRGLTILCVLAKYAKYASCNVPWNKLPNNTGDYCPSSDICIWEHQTEPDSTGGDNCCTDCSCQETCGKDRTCCFPELDTTQGSYKKYKSCLYLSIPEVESRYASGLIHYLMVDSNPDDGCIVDVPEIPEGEQCGNVPVAFWGTKYPVYSKLKKTIYKNQYCAQCHNASDAIITLPSVALHDCRLKDVIDAVLTNRSMNDELTERRGFVSFSFPDVELKHAQCYINVIDTCQTDFDVPSDMKMTKNEIEQACTSELFSPYTYRQGNAVNVYSNVFCAICNDRISNPHFGCPLLNERPFTTSNAKFSTLFISDFTNFTSTASLTNQRKVCFSKENKKVECRRLFCPKEKFLINGVCKYLSHRLYGYPYFVTLRLVPDKGVRIEIDHLLDEIGKKNQMVGKQSAWTKKWEIFRLYLKDNTYTSNSTVVEELIVQMRYRAGTINPVKLFDSIQFNLLSPRFTLVVGNTTYTFQQTLADYYMFPIFQRKRSLGSKSSLHGVESISNQTVLDKIYRDNVYTIVPSKYFKRLTSILFAITQTHFCDLVQLEKDEYTMYAKSILYYIFLDTYFIDGQFDLTIDDNGEPIVRICMSKSGFRVTNNASPTSIFYIDLKIAICFVLFSIIDKI